MHTGRLKVLILGGYGTFGGRLAKLLADEPRLTLVIAGRSGEKAAAFCRDLGARAETVPLVFDREGEVDAQLRAAAPDIVVDASGPFQFYGADPYRVVRACLALGIHYLDLADGSDFVKGIAQFDAAAKRKDLRILAGVSSFPVLTAVVTRRLSAGMARLDTVSAGIAPSPYAGVGENVVRAIASYAGKPLDLGPGVRRYALVDARRYTIAPPGYLPLRPTRFSLVDVPDLKVLPELWPRLRRVWMGAGPVPEILHRALNVCARLVRWRLMPSLVWLAPAMYRAINVVRWGEHRGGMFVEVAGVGARGEPVERSWHMVAERDDGPFIPSMAAEAVLRRWLAGARPAAGARAATADLELSDYEALFARRRIVTGTRAPLPPETPLYRRILGEAFERLPAPVRAMHDVERELVAEGVADIERGSGPLARLGAAIMRFPPAGRDVPLTVTFKAERGREIWRRNFGGSILQSVQEEGRGRFERLIVERFGPIALGLAVIVEGDRLRLIVRRWTFLGLPLPLALVPYGDAFESADENRFNFHVEIAHRLTGPIVRYRGWLVPRA